MIAALRGSPDARASAVIVALRDGLSRILDGSSSSRAVRSSPARQSPGARLAWRRQQTLEMRRLRGRVELAAGSAEPRSPAPQAPGPTPSRAAPEKKDDDVDYVFRGVIHGEMLSDMLQLVSSNEMTGLFEVSGEPGRVQLHCLGGKIVHAEGVGVTGEDAFFSAFGFGAGSYSFRATDELPEERTINSGTQFLILEALRRIDEGNAGA